MFPTGRAHRVQVGFPAEDEPPWLVIAQRNLQLSQRQVIWHEPGEKRRRVGSPLAFSDHSRNL